MRRGLSRHSNRSSGTLFSPLSLFAGGVNGVWYDPSDSSTLFEDTAGTTPSPTPGAGALSVVGKMLDKSGNGNHAISYNPTTARPELSARVNLLTYSEQFDNLAWTVQYATTANTTATTDPLGGNTADILTDNAVNTEHRVFQTPINLAGTYVWSFYAKANTLSWLHLGIPDAAGVRQDIYFDVGNGVKGTVPAGYTATITPAGSGWWRCTVTGATQANAYWVLATSTADNVQSYAGTGQSLYIWGADMRPANIGTSVPAYQRIADQYTYDSSGFPRYLVFNGTASGMYTPANLNLSGTDKATVFAGVRKQSDAAQGAAIGLGNFGSVTGAFELGTSSGGGANYLMGLRGSGSNSSWTYSTYAAPVSNVLASSLDLAAAPASKVSTRINAAVNAGTWSTADAGTGYFGTYPLNIGTRNAAGGAPTTLFFNGYIYSLIVVGAASTAAQISSTESWINVKEGGVY